MRTGSNKKEDRYERALRVVKQQQAEARNGKPPLTMYAIWEERVIEGRIAVGLRGVWTEKHLAENSREAIQRCARDNGRTWIEPIWIDHAYGFDDLNRATLAFVRSQVARWRAGAY